MDEEKEDRRGFQVRDRRRFSATGDARPEDAAPGERAAERDPEPRPERAPVEAQAPEEPLTFSTFVLGLSTQALLHLGEVPNPVTNALERDLAAAKQVIDILGILREKTRNNLEPGEEALLDRMLYDLRMTYVELSRGGTGGPKETP